MALHNEIAFEDEICEHLAANGWLFADGDATPCGDVDLRCCDENDRRGENCRCEGQQK